MHSINNRRGAACAALVLASVALATTQGCFSDETPHPTSTVSVNRPGELRALSAEQQVRVERARAQAGWVGDAHHAAMRVVIADMRTRRATKRARPRVGNAEYCSVMDAVGTKALEVLDAHSRITRNGRERSAVVRQDPALRACSRGLAIFGLASTPARGVSASAQSDEPQVTGEYEQYLDQLEAVVAGSDGSLEGIQLGLYGVLSQAASTGIPEGDLLALASFTSLIESSASEWNAFDWSSVGGGGGCITSDGCYLMSLFPLQGGDKVKKVIAADVGGCLSGVRSWGALRLLIFTPAWQALAGYCGVRGAIASAVAVYVM